MGATVHSKTEIENQRIAVYDTVTVSSGEGISDAIVLEGQAVVRIITPGDWVTASAPTVSLAVSEDGTTYRQVYYWNNASPTTAVIGAVTVATGCSYAIPSSWTDGAYSVKVVSGTVAATTPVEHDHVVGLVYRLV